MELLDLLERQLTGQESPFRAQLAREDIARLCVLRDLLHASPSLTDFIDKGMRIGWTPGDTRTHEVKEPLQALLSALHQAHAHDDEERRQAVRKAWSAFNQLRMKKLVHCL
ncbi:MAG: hypothetical protein ACOY99_03935 [Pseudomonadota bacterium]